MYLELFGCTLVAQGVTIREFGYTIMVNSSRISRYTNSYPFQAHILNFWIAKGGGGGHHGAGGHQNLTSRESVGLCGRHAGVGRGAKVKIQCLKRKVPNPSKLL